ncbi:MAG: transposase [Devosia sp.]
MAISNSRLVSVDTETVILRWQDYRAPDRARQKGIHLSTSDFNRRFPMHLPPEGFHRVRHYGPFASRTRRSTTAAIRRLFEPGVPEDADVTGTTPTTRQSSNRAYANHRPTAWASCVSSNPSDWGRCHAAAISPER